MSMKHPSGDHDNCSKPHFSRWQLNADAMATEKLAEGIRNFADDIVKLEKIIRDRLKSAA